jgi:hypothetical protein
VIVAVAVVPMVQPAVDQVIEVVAVRHTLVAAAVVVALADHWSAGIRVDAADGNDVLVVVAIVGAVQMAVVQEADVPLVLDAGVTAVLAVCMLVVGVDRVRHSYSFLSRAAGNLSSHFFGRPEETATLFGPAFLILPLPLWAG